MSLTRQSPIVTLPPTTGPAYLSNEVIVYVPTSGRVWQAVFDWYGSAPASFGIIDPSDWTVDGYTTDSTRSYGSIYQAEYCAALDCVFAATNYPNKAVRFDSAGNVEWSVAGGGFVVDQSTGRLFAVNDSGPSFAINEYDPADGSLIGTVYSATGSYVNQALIDPAGGVMWLSVQHYSGSPSTWQWSRVIRLDMSDWSSTTLYDAGSVGDEAVWMAYNPTANTLVCILNDYDTSAPYNSRAKIIDADDGTVALATTTLAYRVWFMTSVHTHVDTVRNVAWLSSYDNSGPDVYRLVAYDLDTLSVVYDEEYPGTGWRYWQAIAHPDLGVIATGYQLIEYYDEVYATDDSLDLYPIFVWENIAPSGGVRRQLYLP